MSDYLNAADLQSTWPRDAVDPQWTRPHAVLWRGLGEGPDDGKEKPSEAGLLTAMSALARK